ncbi:unnamed protein product [Gongylonema pulchrum]|uniref:EF hand n=1 Tax=Gongylonema pulchrum TaxID=637853 RepID=A0A183EVU5_9BILA|nr:unnamed protein product [Gongylonema pulchrum]VDN44801.1 unnamed protein product [Gongylonema pulchrum]
MCCAEQEVRNMFRQHDKDMSGFISKDDVMCMLLNATKDEKRDPAFRTNLRFLINTIKAADKDGDDKITFEEFKDYIHNVTASPH